MYKHIELSQSESEKVSFTKDCDLPILLRAKVLFNKWIDKKKRTKYREDNGDICKICKHYETDNTSPLTGTCKIRHDGTFVSIVAASVCHTDSCDLFEWIYKYGK